MPSVCVVTGGAGGIGLAAARIVGRDHRIVISDVDPAALQAGAADLEKAGITCKPVLCDVTDRASVAELISTANTFGTVSSVIHTAGVSPSMGSVERILRINALGTVHVNEGFYSLAGSGFAIVNVASMAAHMFPRIIIPRRRFSVALRDEESFVAKMTSACSVVPRSARAGLAYSISKNFVTWYTASQAVRFGSRGARILSVSPGTIDTAMGRLEEQTGSGAIVRYGALKRLGRPEEVAELLAFCASEKSSYMTGIDVACDGGVLASITLRDMIAVARRT